MTGAAAPSSRARPRRRAGAKALSARPPRRAPRSTAKVAAAGWGAGIRTPITGAKGRSLAVRRPPKRCRRKCSSAPAGDGLDRRDPRRRPAARGCARRRRSSPTTSAGGRCWPGRVDAARARSGLPSDRGRRCRPGMCRRRESVRASRSRCRRSPAAPPTRSPAPAAIDRDATVIVLSGDVPLIEPELLGRWPRRTPRAGAAATLVTVDARGSPRLRPRRARRRRCRRARRRDEGRGRRERRRARDPRGQRRHLRLRRRRPARRARAGGLANAQGERYLPDVLAILLRAGATVAAHRGQRSGDRARGQRPPRPRHGHRPRPAAHPGAPHARRRDDRLSRPPRRST